MTERMDIAKEVLRFMTEPHIGGRVWNHAITLKTNTQLPLMEGEMCVRGWHARLDCTLLGRNWANKYSAERTFFVLVPEYGRSCTDLHYHGLVSWAPVHSHLVDHALVECCWSQVCDRGTVKLTPVSDLDGWARYCITEKTDDGDRQITRHVNEFLISTMFRKKRSVEE